MSSAVCVSTVGVEMLGAVTNALLGLEDGAATAENVYWNVIFNG